MECVKSVCVRISVGGEWMRIGLDLYQSCGNMGVLDVCLCGGGVGRGLGT